jgi:hypothetical protein
LSDSELTSVEERLSISFSDDHRALLQAALPVGEGWYDWRSQKTKELRTVLSRPLDGVLFDVGQNDFWPASWGERPSDKQTALLVTRWKFEDVPQLIPILGHRYLAAAPAPSGSPVFSVHQTDVIYYGHDVLSYLKHEFEGAEFLANEAPRVRIPFWSDLAEGAENEDL